MICPYCGTEVEITRKDQKHCRSEKCIIAHRSFYNKNHPGRNRCRAPLTTSNVKTLCKCPKCEKTHVVVGCVDRSKRVYCPECERFRNQSEIDYYLVKTRG